MDPAYPKISYKHITNHVPRYQRCMISAAYEACYSLSRLFILVLAFLCGIMCYTYLVLLPLAYKACRTIYAFMAVCTISAFTLSMHTRQVAFSMHTRQVAFLCIQGRSHSVCIQDMSNYLCIHGILHYLCHNGRSHTSAYKAALTISL